jgi:L-rhamnose mutarotase
MPQYILACDLKNDPALIAEYEKYHQAVWPEVLQSLQDAGIRRMEIFRTGNRLTMLIDTTGDFSFERKANMDNANPKVQAWEKIMGTFQDQLPHAPAGVKWLPMEKIFDTGGENKP